MNKINNNSRTFSRLHWPTDSLCLPVCKKTFANLRIMELNLCVVFLEKLRWFMRISDTLTTVMHLLHASTAFWFIGSWYVVTSD